MDLNKKALLASPFLLLSLLAHFLLFAGFAWQWTFFTPVDDEKKPGLYIPSYAYQPPNQVTHQDQPKKHKEISKKGIEKSAAKEPQPESVLDHPQDIQSDKDIDGVHLIGDKNISKPLITLLGKALTRHLLYPKVAIDFRLQGTAVLRFTVYPDGSVTNIQLIQSAGTSILDKAALTAANAIAPVKGVGQYLTEPKEMTVGIIFG
ncbi:hypothetical protein AYO45_05115 [Gammaproteobacteria bacterium SCGC AG-212-F23]|nr:hypothetical protein AYO45_05115 [Gammaproteobacteria bacterium SCGC AG-212-F23]